MAKNNNKIELYKNGFTSRLENKKLYCSENEVTGGMSLTFMRMSKEGEDPLESTVWSGVVKGCRVTKINLSHEMLEDLAMGYLRYQAEKSSSNK